MDVGAGTRWMGALILAIALLNPASAAAQSNASDRTDEGPVLVEPGPILPDPATFDPASTTDTEVNRMRLRIMFAELDARLTDRSATATLQWRRAEQRAREDERNTARAAVETIRSILAVTAIDGFVVDTNTALGELFLPTLDGETTATLAGETAQRLLDNRTTAEAALVEAEAALAEARAAAEEAKSAKTEALVALRDAVTATEAFEQRAAEQRSLADAADAEAAAVSSEVPLRSVAGVMHVNAAIEADVDRLITDAREQGIDLGGGSFRTIEAQIGLRLAHCGGSVPPDVAVPGADAPPEEIAIYDAAVAGWNHHVIYEVPAGACSPPTATPGNSEHQHGLAIDFTEKGTVLTRTSPGFVWLTEHAEDYGLFNLPSEPWHWSTTGG